LQITNEQPALIGQSVFGKQPNHDYAINFSDNTYRVFLKEYYIEGTLDKAFIIKNYKDEYLRDVNEKERNLIQAIIQYYNNGMIENTYYRWGKTKASN